MLGAFEVIFRVRNWRDPHARSFRNHRSGEKLTRSSREELSKSSFRWEIDEIPTLGAFEVIFRLRTWCDPHAGSSEISSNLPRLHPKSGTLCQLGMTRKATSGILAQEDSVPAPQFYVQHNTTPKNKTSSTSWAKRAAEKGGSDDQISKNKTSRYQIWTSTTRPTRAWWVSAWRFTA